MSVLLDVQDLSVAFGPVGAVELVSFQVRAGETLAIVGESSSGKSVTALAIMRLLPPPPGCRIGGRVLLHDAEGRAATDLLTLPESAMRRVRGGQIGMIFQEPMTSLNPLLTVGRQIAEALIEHEGCSAAAAGRRAAELLDTVGIAEPRRRLASYPHHLSGGMRQRVMIAMALACRPRLLIADEPTTALDVTIQAQILDLLRRLQREHGMAVIFITHNLGVVAEIADRVVVMYSGQVVEQAQTDTVLRRPLMPYTRGLLRSVPRLDAALRPSGRLQAIPGSVPDPRQRPPGCTFEPRCDNAVPALCCAARPVLELAAADHAVRCRRWRELAA
ncbi:MAG: ABC transporter ATP-binding protein [Acetobacteraceae bacterium]|nr:ABC transporter ATP-binding protein [Acetobacteraceae bacterium]